MGYNCIEVTNLGRERLAGDINLQSNLLRTFDKPRKIYVDIDPDWCLIQSLWRDENLAAGKFDVDDSGVWQMFSLSENGHALLKSQRD